MVSATVMTNKAAGIDLTQIAMPKNCNRSQSLNAIKYHILYLTHITTALLLNILATVIIV